MHGTEFCQKSIASSLRALTTEKSIQEKVAWEKVTVFGCVKYVVIRDLFPTLLKVLPAVKFSDRLAVVSRVSRGTDGKRDFCMRGVQ